MRNSPSQDSNAAPDDDLADVPRISATGAVRGELTTAVAEIAAGSGQRHLVVRYGEPQAALVSLDDLRTLLRLDGWSRADIELLKERARESADAQEETTDA